ncbi:hypothetical protein ATCC90586_001147 [Pythium insidiosum]|nr:hypothetical protein ATCC90586_001147 [Pythium insidiosum]
MIQGLYLAVMAAALSAAQAMDFKWYPLCYYSDGNQCPLSSIEIPEPKRSALIFPGGKTRCAFNDFLSDQANLRTNGTFFFEILPKPSSKKLMIYWQGGGACLDDVTCNFAFQCASPTRTFATFPFPYDGGILHPTDPMNPFHDWNMVHIPYCTGDLHAGNKVIEAYDDPLLSLFNRPQCIGQKQKTHLSGLENSLAALKWARTNFPDVEHIVLSGTSAGSLASQLLSSYVSDLWDVKTTGKRLSIVADSYVGVLPANREAGNVLNYFGTCDADLRLPASVVSACKDQSLTVPQFGTTVLKTHPHIEWMFINSKGDSTQRLFYELARVGPFGYPFPNTPTEEQFYEEMVKILDKYKSVSSQVTTFFIPGSDHTLVEAELLAAEAYLSGAHALRADAAATSIAATFLRQDSLKRISGSGSAKEKLFPWLTLSPRRGNRHGFEVGASSQRRHERDQHLIDRLHLDVTARYAERERAREQLEAQRLRECTFRPRINPASRRLVGLKDYKPIHERVDELQRAKHEYIQRIRQEMALEQEGFMFAPRINPRSRDIAAALQLERLQDDKQRDVKSTPSVTERLAEDADRLAERRLAMQEYYDALADQAFAPMISEASSRIVEQRPEFQLDFLSRQAYFEMIEQERLEALEDKLIQASDLTFHPDTGNAEHVLRELRPHRCRETESQRLYRLIYGDPKQVELKKQRLREAERSRFTFKPEINPISKALAARSAGKAASTGGAEAAARREELRRYFAGKRFRSRQRVVVRGLGRFLELRERAKQQREEQREREARVFHPDHAYQPRSYTIPKPFRLSESSRDAHRRRETVREQLRAREREECTFSPETIESRHRKVIQNILRQQHI